MGDFERRNQRAIDGLNQRGGRMLSLVDLLDAGTVGLDLAAELAQAAGRGGSFLTAAGPGGVGKTTLMGAVLAFLPPGTEIVTVEGPRTLAGLAGGPPDPPQCAVVHEIGAGSYYGYLWGPAVAAYLDLARAAGRSIASNLHAETYDRAAGQLTGPPLGVSVEALGGVDLLAFMARVGPKRRVTSVWQAAGGAHEMTWRWSPGDDAFERVGPAGREDDLRRFGDFLERAWRDGCREMESLRRRALDQLFAPAGDGP